ncbi:methyl-CpG-binding domain-containing protein 13 isoform X1 [Cucumis melo var. makuwa]|uniref:Methyl-CpG-binding domain-containing protein 13 isoform X1 n=1 Tax=Cucumis melo var. makuwa TaxID=1194695 RepID=A0A5D3D046_CUCMM|nr:methyl-CpG-binding domain-containing protein 13 isoform X1 [Cucumis melo var. makuwa]
MVITAHFIDDDWNLHKRILNFCQVANHKGDTIGRAIEKCLEGWGIDRLFTVTVDNASSNDVVIAYLVKKFKGRNGLVLDEALICAQNWIQSKPFDDMIEEIDGAEEIDEEFINIGKEMEVAFENLNNDSMYYFEPSSQMRFNSRAEVFRYLKTAAICHPKSEESRTVKEPGNNSYINPVNGHALRSIRDVHQYLTSGKVSRLAHKSRNQRDSTIDLQHDEISVSVLESHVVSKKEVLTIGKARRQIIWSENSSEPSEIVDDEAMFPSATSVGEIVPFQKPDSSLGIVLNMQL